MRCPECDNKTKVIDSRHVDDLITRRRRCCNCGYAFYTEELEVVNGLSFTKYREYLKGKVVPDNSPVKDLVNYMLDDKDNFAQMLRNENIEELSFIIRRYLEDKGYTIKRKN